jgi:hypothetical protein
MYHDDVGGAGLEFRPFFLADSDFDREWIVRGFSKFQPSHKPWLCLGGGDGFILSSSWIEECIKVTI